MDPARLLALLNDVAAGTLTPAAAHQRLEELPYADLDYAKVDHHRAVRCGFPEVIYGAGKTPDRLRGIVAHMRARQAPILVTRLEATVAADLLKEFPAATYHADARVLLWCDPAPTPRPGRLAVVSAGTSDAGVALEAWHTLRFFGHEPQLIQDVGVAGIHRLLAREKDLRACQVIIVCAGMEGALPSVIGGMVACPIIAVPTSIGYGAGQGGIAALLAMLNSCASGVAVMNIDNGFGAACAAARIASLLPPL
jgi:pyridinium-3,5-biscarboxylic acid mononucleotide synthase